jgi:signal transduction histidine kinase
MREKEKKHIESLEDEILELTFKLKNKKNEVNSIFQSQEKLMRKLIHDLKNPVGVVYSFSDMILEDIETYDTHKLEKHVTVIKNAADFSLHFLNQTSKFSSLVYKNGSFLLVKLNVVTFLNQVVNQFEQIALNKNITIKKDFHIEESILLIDKEQLTIALSNILNNAIRFSSENTTIVISVLESEDSVEIVITDEGIGVDTVDLTSVFQEYFVVNTYSIDKKKCVGLGLTIAKKIIQQHKGLISIESVLGKGSSVKIVFPKDNFTS